MAGITLQLGLLYIALAGLKLLILLLQHPKCSDHKQALPRPAFSHASPHLQVSEGVACHVAPEEFPRVALETPQMGEPAVQRAIETWRQQAATSQVRNWVSWSGAPAGLTVKYQDTNAQWLPLLCPADVRMNSTTQSHREQL
jgi:hypothetical protein